MADQRLRNKRELKHLFTNLRRKGITDEMISILIDTLWRDRANNRTSGFRIRGGTDAVISINPITRIFTIAPFDPEDENYQPRYGIFVWNNVAVLHRIYDIKTIEIPDEEGLFCIYFDKEEDPGTSQVLTFIKNPSQPEIENIVENKVLISFLYWDATDKAALHFGDDRHGSEWNPQIHQYLYTAFGARRKNGLQFTGFSLNGDGSENAHAKFSILGGVMLHDDFELTIPSSSDSIPILYLQGFTPRYTSNSGYAIKVAGRACYNTGGAVVPAASGNYVLYHIFATNEILTASRKIISVMGSAEYTSLADAYSAAPAELDALNTWMPQQGRFHIDTIVVQTSDDFTNDASSIIVSIAAKTHPPVTIADNSKDLLEITGKQELSIPGEFEADEFYAIKNRIWQKITAGGGGDYDWNLHSPEQIIGDLDEPTNIIATIDGTGATDTTIPAGTYAIVALNEAGETLPVNVPEMVILIDTTSVVVSWDAVTGASAYRVYEVATGFYFDLAANTWDYLTETPATAGTLPVSNTAYIYQNPFTIDNGDTVRFIGNGVDIETEVDELDTTKKIVTLKKQQSDLGEEDPESPNFIKGKSLIPTNTDEKVKFDAADPAAGYLSEKIIAGTNITIEQGTGADEYKLKISSTAIGGGGLSEIPFEFCVTGGYAETFDIDIYVVNDYVVSKLILECDGTLTGVNLKINTSLVTGLENMTVSTLTVFNATAANEAVTGDRITISVTTGYSGTPTLLKGKLVVV